MMRYRKISTQIWNDQRFRELSDRGKLVFFMLLTHQHMTSLGAMRGTIPGLSVEIGWQKKDFTKAFREALGKGMVEYSETHAFIALPNFLKHNPPESPNVVVSWGKALELLPECQLKRKLILRVRQYSESLSEKFRQALPEAFTEAFGKAIANQEQEQEQEQDTPPIVPLKGDPPEDEPKPAPKETLHDHQPTVDLWHQLYQEHVGQKFVWEGRDFKIIEQLLKAHGKIVVWARMKPYLCGWKSYWPHKDGKSLPTWRVFKEIFQEIKPFDLGDIQKKKLTKEERAAQREAVFGKRE